MLAQPIAHPGWLTARRMNRVRTDVAGLVFALPFLVFYVLFTVWPIISGLLMSFFKVSLPGGINGAGGANTLDYFGLSGPVTVDVGAHLKHTLGDLFTRYQNLQLRHGDSY